MATQLCQHMPNHMLYDIFQSGFRSHHSTETVLIKVTMNFSSLPTPTTSACSSSSTSQQPPMQCPTPSSSIAYLTILASQVPFSPGSCNILPTRNSWLQQPPGTSQPQCFPGSCAQRRLLFIIYMLPLGWIIRRHCRHFHCYADDSTISAPHFLIHSPHSHSSPALKI